MAKELAFAWSSSWRQSLGGSHETFQAAGLIDRSSGRKNGDGSDMYTRLSISCMADRPDSASGGTRYIREKKVKVLQFGDKSAKLRDKIIEEPAAVKLLSRVEQLRLLSKAEKAGLLSAAEKAGLSLSTIEKLGLLSKAEELGILSAATDPSTPGSLLVLAITLFIAAPVFVYFVPEDTAWEAIIQVVVALVAVLGGSLSFAASRFLSILQQSD